MSSPQFEVGAEDLKQFKKLTVAAGPLKGARYPEVCWSDLRKAAKSYKQDPRFNQYAKRMMSERALGAASKGDDKPNESAKTWKMWITEWAVWLFVKAKGKALLALCLGFLTLLLLSRPLFYVVLTRSLTMAVRLLLRRSVGLVVLLMDAILDEAAANSEASLISPPVVHNTPVSSNVQAFEVQQYHSYSMVLFHIFFTCLGALLGRHLPRNQVYRAPHAARPPDRLRVV